MCVVGGAQDGVGNSSTNLLGDGLVSPFLGLNDRLGQLVLAVGGIGGICLRCDGWWDGHIGALVSLTVGPLLLGKFGPCMIFDLCMSASVIEQFIISFLPNITSSLNNLSG